MTFVTHSAASLVDETNGLTDGHAYHSSVEYKGEYTLREVADLGGRITRVRILAEGQRCDISYIHATFPSGKIIPVRVGAYPTLTRNVKAEFIAWAKEEGVYAKALGLLDEANWSVLR